jgi:DNA topoisomerase-3
MKVLCVAEKPSLAAAIATHLASDASSGTLATRRGGATEAHDFDGRSFAGRRDARWTVTSVMGHVASVDFPERYRNWETCEPGELFAAPTVKRADGGVARHLEREARGADYLILWLDCDREGENICFEVIEACAPTMKPRTRDGERRILRAKFSAVTKESVERAMTTLGEPNRNEALAVDARQELDLKMGVAFTRFQTQYFLNKYDRLDARVVSYGPCQTPTLGFCVRRHLDILRHVPEPYWTLDASFESSDSSETSANPTDGALDCVVTPTWARSRLFDEETARAFLRLVDEAREFRVADVRVEPATRARPCGLNTVEMLKAASAGLGMGAHRAMQVAERLYMAGHISYPRTESTAYPRGFALRETLATQRAHPVWGAYVTALLDDGNMTMPRRGVDAGDHPPITPMQASTEERVGGGEAWRLYAFIARRFIASVSPDCAYETQTATLTAGGEEFTLRGTTVLDHGWTQIEPHRMIEERPLPSVVVAGARVPMSSARLRRETTSPPGYLTESELIDLMEKNGIGTDASIPTHINNIQVRKYVDIEKGRRVVPTALGVALAQGYRAIDDELVLPTVRRHVEHQLDLIAKGLAPYEGVVEHVLAQMFDKFNHFAANIGAMDALFGASFSHASTESTPYSKCGRCSRYLRLVGASGRIQRLHCPIEEVVYELPAGGVFKRHNGATCRLCGFELLIFSPKGTGRHFPLCPFCFNHPPYDGAPRIKATLTGSPHPREHPVADDVATSPCPECADGVLMLDPTAPSPPKLHCSTCSVLVRLPRDVRRARVSADAECAACGSKCLDVEYFAGERRLACLACEDTLRERARVARSPASAPGGRGGRGGRGRRDARR